MVAIFDIPNVDLACDHVFAQIAMMEDSTPPGEAMSRKKLSPEAKQLIDAIALDQGMAEARPETDVLVRTTREISTDDRVALESLGATVRTVAGDVLTANVPVDRLQELADLDVVAYVEVSRPLAPEWPSTHGEPRTGEES